MPETDVIKVDSKTHSERPDDTDVLESLGYKPELKRVFSKWEIFGVSFSIMCLAPSVASIFVIPAMSGTVGMVWGWFVPCFFVMSIGMALSEFSSAMPTSGGVYYWTYKFAPKKFRRSLCFLCGYMNTLSQIAGAGSVNYGLAEQLLSCPAMALDYSPTKYHTYGVYAACLIAETLLGILPNKVVARLQAFIISLNAVAVALVVIALPVGVVRQGGTLNSGSFVFGDTTNVTGYSYGWAYLVSWLGCLWTISSLDACIHMSEEASNAAVAVPFGILLSIGLCWVFGFLLMIILAACMNPDYSALGTASGNVMAQVISDALNEKWAIALMSLFAFINFTMGLSGTVAASRQTWAFARDGALPFSNLVRKLNSRQIPVNAIIFNTIVAILMGLLILADDAAATAIFSLGVTSSYFSWTVPPLFRAISFDPGAFTPGPFYLGHTLSRINCIIASVFGIFVIFALTIIPSSLPVNAQSMNYTVLICGAVWIGCMLYYFIDAHKWFQGPKSTLDNGIEVFESLSNEKSYSNCAVKDADKRGSEEQSTD